MWLRAPPYAAPIKKQQLLGNNPTHVSSTKALLQEALAQLYRLGKTNHTREKLGQSLCGTESTKKGGGQGLQWHRLHDGRQRNNI